MTSSTNIFGVNIQNRLTNYKSDTHMNKLDTLYNDIKDTFNNDSTTIYENIKKWNEELINIQDNKKQDINDDILIIFGYYSTEIYNLISSNLSPPTPEEIYIKLNNLEGILVFDNQYASSKYLLNEIIKTIRLCLCESERTITHKIQIISCGDKPVDSPSGTPHSHRGHHSPHGLHGPYNRHSSGAVSIGGGESNKEKKTTQRKKQSTHKTKKKSSFFSFF